MAQKFGGKWKKIITVVTLLALLVLIYFSRQQIGETLSNFGRVQTSFLLLIILWKFLVFHGYSKMYIEMFKILGKKIEYWAMFKITLELNFVNNIFPSGGVTGFSYFGLKMYEFGISAGKSTLVQAMRFINTFVSFQVFILVGLLVLAVAGQANDLTILVASSLTTLLVVGTILLAYIIRSRERISGFFTFIAKVLNRLIHLVRPKDPETISIAAARKMFYELHDNYLEIKKDIGKLKKPIIYISLANFGEIAALYSVFLAFGHPVNPGAVIIAYAIANFAGLISVLPGGIGIYEGLMVAVLATGGVPPAVSIPAVIMYRILTMAVQLPIGYYFYHQTINSKGGIGKNINDIGKI
jgi:uncharacterized protein (TIRG00374 family)